MTAFFIDLTVKKHYASYTLYALNSSLSNNLFKYIL